MGSPSAPRADLGQYAHGQFRVDYEDRPDHAVLRGKRIQRARDAMDAAGVDAVLVWKNENVRYLTSLRAQIIAGKSAVLNGCLLVRDHDPILLCSGGEIERVRLVMTWIEEAYAVPDHGGARAGSWHGGKHPQATVRAARHQRREGRRRRMRASLWCRPSATRCRT